MESNGTLGRGPRPIAAPATFPLHGRSLPTLSGAILRNKTGTHGNRVLYVDNRGIVGPSGCGQRIGSTRSGPKRARTGAGSGPKPERPAGPVISRSGERRWREV